MSTPKEIFETKVAPKIQNNPDLAKKVNAAYRIELSGPQGGVWIVDAKEGTCGVRQADESAECTITMTDAHFVDLMNGKLSPQMAFMTGKLKITKGDMGLALKLGQVLKG